MSKERDVAEQILQHIGGKENFVSAYYCTLVCSYAPFTQQSGYLVSAKAALVCLSKAGER